MWDVDFVQFTRLLDEIHAVGLSKDQINAIAASMNVKPEEVKELLGRATQKWETLHPLLAKKTPLTEEQIAEELAENGELEAVITMDFGEIIGQLEDAAVEAVFDDIAERVAGNVSLDNIDYKVLFADNDTLYLTVKAKAEDLDGDDEEDDVEPVVE